MTAGTLAEEHESASRVPAVMLLGLAGVLSQGLAPYIVSGLSQSGWLSAGQAGWCVSAEMAGSVAGVAAILFPLRAARRRRLAIAALALIMAGNVGCLFLHSFAALAGARALAGAGCGLSTVAFGILASSRQPPRYFAIFSGAAVLLIFLLGLAVPWLFRLAGVRGLFAVLAIAAILAASGIGFIADESGPSPRSSAAGRLAPKATIAGLAMTLAFYTALGSLWPYVGELGRASGIDTAALARIIAFAFLSGGVGGSILSSVLAQSARGATVIGWSLSGAIVAVMVLASIPGNRAVYAAALMGFIVCWFLCYPFLMGILADLDRTGRIAVFGVLAQAAGWSCGPALGSHMADRRAYFALGLFCAALFAISFACMWAARAADRLEA